MRRRQGALVPLEAAMLEVAAELARNGRPEFHGFAIAKQLRDREAARRLTAHGTLYKALDRLERAGLLASRWEDPALAAEQGRPRRRLYQVTPLGEQALARALARARAAGGGRASRRPGMAET
jgi:PadR family transcriptional regulator, regulatory protein PadR